VPRCSFSRSLKNVGEAAEPVFNAVSATQIVFSTAC
jgi:hypothetical protein